MAILGLSSRAEAGAARRRRVDLYPYVLVLPTLLLIICFTLAPAIYGLIVSLHDVQFVRLRGFVGLDNYFELLRQPRTLVNLRNSFVLALGSVFFTFLFSLLLALALNERVWFRVGFRTLILIPWVASYVVTNLLAKWMLDFNYGIVNQTLRALGLPTIQFLGEPLNALLSLIFTNVWLSASFAMVLLLAGLQGIPQELYEAAAVDGAAKARRFFAITLPLMKYPIIIVLLLLTIRDFSILVSVLVLTGGGPGYTTETLTVRMFWEAFVNFQMGTASALATIIFAINLIFSMVYIRFMRSHPY
jgi:ABC-type sugar transport system permease subunit